MMSITPRSRRTRPALGRRVPPWSKEGKQLNWMVTQGLLERGAVFAFASNERQSGQVLLSNLFNNTATVV